MGVYAMDAWRAGAFLRALWSQRERVNLRYGWQTYIPCALSAPHPASGTERRTLVMGVSTESLSTPELIAWGRAEVATAAGRSRSRSTGAITQVRACEAANAPSKRGRAAVYHTRLPGGGLKCAGRGTLQLAHVMHDGTNIRNLELGCTQLARVDCGDEATARAHSIHYGVARAPRHFLAPRPQRCIIKFKARACQHQGAVSSPVEE